MGVNSASYVYFNTNPHLFNYSRFSFILRRELLPRFPTEWGYRCGDFLIYPTITILLSQVKSHKFHMVYYTIFVYDNSYHRVVIRCINATRELKG